MPHATFTPEQVQYLRDLLAAPVGVVREDTQTMCRALLAYIEEETEAAPHVSVKVH